MVNYMPNDCLNLPTSWADRVSSIFTNNCIILFTEVDCNSDRFKATLIRDKVYFEDSSRQISNLPSFNFFGSW
jgi:hypothetical protein